MSDGTEQHPLPTSGEFDGPLVEDQWTSIRPLGWASVICAVLWLGGFGSFFAVGFGLIGIIGRDNVVTDQQPPPGLRMCQVGVALGLIGLLATAIWLLGLG
jgi:hypothetical protein